MIFYTKDVKTALALSMCHTVNIKTKRIKVVDASAQAILCT